MGEQKRAGQPAQGFMAIGRVVEPGVYPAEKGVPSPACREDLLGKGKQRFSGGDKMPGGRDGPPWREAQEHVRMWRLVGPCLCDSGRTDEG